MLKGKKLGDSQELRANIEGSELRAKKKTNSQLTIFHKNVKLKKRSRQLYAKNTLSKRKIK